MPDDDTLRPQGQLSSAFNHSVLLVLAIKLPRNLSAEDVSLQINAPVKMVFLCLTLFL